MRRIKKRVRNTMIIIFIVLLVITAAIMMFLSRRIKPNPVGTVGNTGGNLNNGGFVCEHDGTVFFANASEGGHLFCMNVDETDVRQINDMNVCNILADEHYVYFFQLGQAEEGQGSGFTSMLSVKSFIRSDQTGKNTATLTRDTVLHAQLVDNSLYLLTTGKQLSFQKMKIDKSNVVKLADYEINPSSVYNGVIYYNGTQTNHYLYGLNTSNDSTAEIWRGNLWYPVAAGDYVYYLDVSDNYRLCRYSLTNDWVEVLTSDRVDCYNVGNGYIYYQSNGATPQLICMRTDGSSPFVLADGIYTNINMTSQYVYFQELGNESIWYHSPLGGGWMEPFIVR
ncbi:MAG: DUF5050 domain-containing protein [Lachnospiraceae bacterium]|nr:DUF5050 domain-containing protein [Lachnospiraceae bacterium]